MRSPQRLNRSNRAVDATSGVLTTQKLDALLSTSGRGDLASKKDLAQAMRKAGVRISNYGVEAWFRHIDRNYQGVPRRSLSDSASSYKIPRRHVAVILDLFGLHLEALEKPDDAFRAECFQRRNVRIEAEPRLLAPPLAPPELLIGREDAYQQIRAAFVRAIDSQPAVVFTMGDAGVGKSTLINAFVNALQDVECVRLFGGAVEGGNTPLTPVMDMLRMDEDRLVAAFPQLQERMRVLFDLYHRAGAIDGGASAMFSHIADVLLAIAREKPLIATIEDCHWADESTLRFLEYLCGSVIARHGARLIVIVTSRNVEADHRLNLLIRRFAKQEYATLLQLAPLSLAQTAELLALEAKVPLSDELVQFVYELSMGSPLFSREILASLQRQGAVYTRRGRLFRNPRSVVGGLEDVGSIYQETFMRLSSATKDVLGYVAVWDRRVDIAQLELLMPNKGFAVIADAVEIAERAELLKHERGQYLFAHPLIRNQVYLSLHETRRMRIHYAIAEFMIAREQPATDYEQIQIAHHLLRAPAFAPPRLLADYCVKAAAQARFAGAWDQALTFANVALGVGPVSGVADIGIGELLETAGDALHALGEPVKAVERLEDAAKRFDAAGARALYADARNQIVRIKSNYALDDADDQQEMNELIELAGEVAASDCKLACLMYDTISVRSMYAGRAEQSLRFAHDAVAVVRTETNCTQRALAMTQCGIAAMQLLRLRSAYTWFQQARDVAADIRDVLTLARVQQQTSLLSLMLGRLDDLERQLAFLAEEGDLIADTGELTVATGARIAVHVLTTHRAPAAAVFDDALESIRRHEYAWALPRLVGAWTAGLCAEAQHDAAEALVTSILTDSSLQKVRGRAEQQLNRLHSFIGLQRARSTSDSKFDLPQGFNFASFAEEEFAADKLTRYAMDLEFALAANNKRQTQVASAALRFAYSRGALFCGGWPIFIVKSIVRSLLFLGQAREAAYYLSVAVDILLRLELWHELRQLIAEVAHNFDVSNVALQMARDALREQFARAS